MSTPTKSPVAANAAGSPSNESERSASPSRIRNLVERSSTFINKRRASFRRNKQDGEGTASSPSTSGPSGRRSPAGQQGQDGPSPAGQEGVVSRVVSKTVGALKWTPIPASNIMGYLPLVILILLIGLSCVGLWTILSATVLKDW